MDKVYDTKAATETLLNFQARRGDVKKKDVQLRDVIKNAAWEEFLVISKFDGPSCWRLTWANDKERTEEVEVHMQGVLEDKRLPPFRGKRKWNRVKHMRQTVTISALGNTTFEQDKNALFDIYAYVARHTNGESDLGVKDLNGRPMIEIGARLFTPKEDAREMQRAIPEDGVDRYGFIEGLNGLESKVMYGTDNVVYYFEERVENGASKRFKISPEKFHVGDVVDVVFTMIAIESGGEGRANKVLLQLRAITLLDGQHTQNWIKLKAQSARTETSEIRQLKKRAIADDEDDENVEEARDRFKRMHIGGAE